MNRTIKFRGKRFDNGEWLYGDLMQCGLHLHICDHEKTVDPNFDFIQTEVHPESIGQFTGLHDKNEKEIYEGDIMRIRNNIGLENVGTVEFIDGCFFVEVEKSETYTFRHALHIKNSVWKDMNANIPIKYEYEVIGNIHDNPELIKI